MGSDETRITKCQLDEANTNTCHSHLRSLKSINCCLLSVVSVIKSKKNTIPTGVHTAKGPNLPQARKKEANPITKLIMEWFLVDIQKGMKIICTHTANLIPLFQMMF